MFDEFEELEDFDIGEEFDDEFDEFDEFDIQMEVRTAILQKNNMVALLCYKGAAQGAAICRVDPREAKPAVQIYDDPAAALEWFTKSLRSSSQNGWNIIYDGLPLQG